MEDIQTMLDREYADTLEALSQCSPGSEEAKWQLQKLAELHKQRMNECEAQSKLAERTDGTSLKRQQMSAEKQDRIIRVVLDSAAILVPTFVSSYWMAKGLQFERTGTFTSRTGNWLSTHFRLFRT